ncbi:cation transporter [Chitinophaga caeni]|uniref:Cation transporter n=1 Tax=Chitinophaga caeni TaxID=2029983 RepID=A0A291QTH8_9BACT|nr:cation diffusion facilitator family transporter [Chitinophaga caeni]ATL47329.1 cation transporter [Chitinophaga caeni]
MHDHSHTHHRSIAALNKAFTWGICLNIGYVIFEAIMGLAIGSLALLSDAGHNLSDVASLALSLLAFRLARLKPNETFTYGYRKSTVLISLLNAVILLLAVGIIGYEAIRRFSNPEPVAGKTVAIVAGVGIVINAFTAYLFLKDKEKDLNVKSAYLHMAADTLVSLGAVVAGLIILWKGWTWVDPVISLVFILVILWSTYGLLRDSLILSLDGVPRNIDLETVRGKMEKVSGVRDVHHLHIWAVSTTDNALTAHVKIEPGLNPERMDQIKNELKHVLEHLGIRHATLELELKHTDDDLGY